MHPFIIININSHPTYFLHAAEEIILKRQIALSYSNAENSSKAPHCILNKIQIPIRIWRIWALPPSSTSSLGRIDPPCPASSHSTGYLSVPKSRDASSL